QILIDDRDIRDFTIEELRKKVGLVLQDAFMFYGDISDNIRLLNPEISEEQIRAAAKFVPSLVNLSKNWRALIMPKMIRTCRPPASSGQRQLISFARTMVTDPKILVLDEATANIDTETS
ncbi:MAG: ATP-binding cassette domain-containing protein, partial [Enterococcus gallinarum]